MPDEALKAAAKAALEKRDGERWTLAQFGTEPEAPTRLELLQEQMHHEKGVIEAAMKRLTALNIERRMLTREAEEVKWGDGD